MNRRTQGTTRANEALVEENSQIATSRILRRFTHLVELISALVLGIDLVIVFVSVIYRYVLHNPLQWSDEVASALLVTLAFLGGAVALARGEHLGVQALRNRMTGSLDALAQAFGGWIILVVAVTLGVSGYRILQVAALETTSSGLSSGIYYYPVLGGAVAMAIFAVASLAGARLRAILLSGAVLIACALLWWLWGVVLTGTQFSPMLLLLIGFVICLAVGVPVAFSLGFAALLFFWTDGTLPLALFAQQMEGGVANFVLLAIPFFVLAGLVMEVNGMSTRLIEFLQLLVGRVRGGLSIVMIVSMAFFSGLSGSKSADVAAVGSLLVPAMSEAGEDRGEAVALLASTAVMGETIPPSINIIILGSVANISIGGLFLAGLLPAAALALALMIVVIVIGGKGRTVSPISALSRAQLIRVTGGAVLALGMIAIIFGGILGGIATPTEVSAFAVVYALIAGGVAFRQMSLRSLYRLFVNSAALSGMILFIIAAAQAIAYILTEQQIPQQMATLMVGLATTYGTWVFLIVAIVFLIIMGSVLEGAPALIIFGPLLIPIGTQLGINALHLGILLIIAMGLGLFAPPLGVGLYTACAVGKVPLERVARPIVKYLIILAIALLIIAFVPWMTTALPHAVHVGG